MTNGINLWSVPNIHTATSHAVQSICKAREKELLYPVEIIVPTTAMLTAVRDQLGSSMGISLRQFYGLSESILAQAGYAVQWLNETTTRRLVHHLLGEMHDQAQLTTFEPIWNKPGFTQSVMTWLREMKSQGISPEHLAAQLPDDNNPRDVQLLNLYQRYQHFMHQHVLSDSEGLLWLAAEVMENQTSIRAPHGLLIVIGFDQFSPIEFRLLQSYAAQFDTFSVYLPWDSDRSEDSLAHTRIKSTRRELKSIFPDAAENFIADTANTTSDLRHLQLVLFETSSKKPKAPSIRAFVAPSREVEVRTVLREIKKLLLADVPFGNISLLAPKPGIYQRTVELVAEEYGIPVRHEEALGVNPAVQTLLKILKLAPNFPRRETLDVLRSSYVQQSWLNEEQIGYLTQLTRERPVIAGASQWHEALAPIEPSLIEEEELGAQKLAATLPAETLHEIEQGLLAFFAHLTPPEQSSHREFTLWVQEIILGFPSEEADGDTPPASLNLLSGCLNGLFARRDQRALAAVMNHLRRLVDAAELLSKASGEPVGWEVYRGDLLDVIPDLTIPPDPFEPAVLFGPLEEGRNRTSNYLFILGLSEGEFPSPPPADPLYASSERVQYAQEFGINLRPPFPADDASLWWMVLSNCHKELVLFRPGIDENGAPWEASPYWQEVMNKAEVTCTDIKVGALPQIEESASPPELLAALAIAGASSIPREYASVWAAAQHSHQIMRKRQSWVPAPAFEGVLQSGDILMAIREKFNDNHSWSASRLNRYGNCPFGFFAQYILKLQADAEPEEGMDVMQRGSLLHQALELLHKRFSSEGLAFTPTTQPAALAFLDEICEKIFQTAPFRFGFRPDALWRYEQQELKRLLANLVTWECQNDSPYKPYLQEFRFGVKGANSPSFRIVDQDGQGFLLHGVVDRVDRADNNSLRVLDYKSGSTKYSTEDMETGRALQNPLYALVVSKTLNTPVLSSAYLSIPGRKMSGDLKFDDGTPESNPTVQAAIDTAVQFVHRIRTGYFPSLPSKPESGSMACAKSCDLAHVCRISRKSLAKARRMESSHGS